ncbi:NAD(P)/FAD-dependent oxidoreductase [Pseudooceanicola sp.]|jgi:thioredoxin reductase|uniref:NAD(P)/FAD-dependent oxidoreductase n=1 Tax=Pseudooceanicola sp. TaxID=1914328 RepID=UPI004059081E
MMHDVIIIGGGYAGMAAALQLLRARRTVAVIDAGRRRNRFASHAHGFLGQDGVRPEQIAADARAQLDRYPDLTWVEEEAQALDGKQDAFAVTLRDGSRVHGRRAVLATGVRDTLPPIDRISERWGRSVFHCPYCHGFELDRGCIGVIGSGPMSIHQAELLTEWGEVVFFRNGSVAVEPDRRDALAKRGVTIEDTGIAAIEGEADIRLTDGRVMPFAGLFVATTVAPASALPQRIGCESVETPVGPAIRRDAAKQTSIPGVYACGDVATAPHSLSLAIGDGAATEMQVHRSLVWPE